MGNMLKIKEIKATIKLENGAETTLHLSPTQIETFVRSNGLFFKEVNEKHFGCFYFDDITLKDNIIPLLPEIKDKD